MLNLTIQLEFDIARNNNVRRITWHPADLRKDTSPIRLLSRLFFLFLHRGYFFHVYARRGVQRVSRTFDHGDLL